MPRISTDNYDTVASWNGSQDLFVVEQPDGTKVATPAMVKQFIEVGDFIATGEIEDGHGNVLKNMAKSADVDVEIGDLSQTGLTGNSVAEQLGDAKNQIAIEKVPNSFITLESGISITTNQLYKQGNHIFGWITFAFPAQTPNNLKLGKLNTGYTTNYNVRMIAGLGTEAWVCEDVGYGTKGVDNFLYVMGYNSNISRAAHIHLDYVV